MDQNTPRRGNRRHDRNAKPNKFAFIKQSMQGLRGLVWCVCRASFLSLRRERVPHANANARGANECGGSAFLEFCRRNSCPRGRAGIPRPPVGTIRLCSVQPSRSILGADGCDRRFCSYAECGGRTAVFLFRKTIVRSAFAIRKFAENRSRTARGVFPCAVGTKQRRE